MGFRLMPIMQRYFSYFMHPSLLARGPDIVLKAKLWLVISAAALGASLVMGTDHMLRGPREQGIALFAVSGVGAALLWVLRRTGRLELVGNVTAGLVFIALTGAVYIRGGAGAPGQFAYGVIPMLAVLCAGWRSGVFWSAMVFAEAVLFALLHGLGVRLPVRVPEASREFSDITMAFFVTGVFVGFSFAYEWYRNAVSRARESAEHERTDAELRRAEAERERERAVQEARLMQASRLAAAGQLAAGVGHEINNPLSYITGNVEYAFSLLEGPRGPDQDVELRGALSDALDGARRVSRIVSDLSTFARHGDEDVRPIALQDSIEIAVKMAQHQIRHRARLELELGENILVRADETRLTQLFLNLLINAAQAMPLGEATDNLVSVVVKEQRDTVVVEISDTGAGIPADIVHLVADPFFTTKKVGEGTGLGLSVCKNIAVQYGGDLEIQSTEGQGTKVSIALPRHHPGAEEIAPEAASDRRPSVQRARVLVVDDEPIIRRTLERTLRDFDVDTVSSGQAALEKLDTETYDAVLCDIMMPDLTGLGVYQHLEQKGSSAIRRFIFLTGGVFSDVMASEIEALPVPLLKKPCTRNELEKAIVAVIGSVESAGQSAAG